MQRYLESWVDLLMAALAAVIAPGLLYLSAHSRIASGLLVVLGLALLLWGYRLLRTVQPAKPSWADTIQMPMGKWSGLAAIYVFMLAQIWAWLLTHLSGLEDYSGTANDTVSDATALAGLAIFVLVFAIILLAMILIISRRHELTHLRESKAGLLNRKLGLMCMDFSLLVFCVVLFVVTQTIHSGSVEREGLAREILISIQVGLDCLLFYVPLHLVKRSYNPRWQTDISFLILILTTLVTLSCCRA